MKGGQPNRVKGECPVCGKPTATPSGVYCETHREASSRPPREEWTVSQDAGREPETEPGPAYRETAGAAEEGNTVAEENTEPAGAGETPPTSPYQGRPSAASPSMGNGAVGGRFRRFLGMKPKGDKPPPAERAPKAPRGRPPRGRRRIPADTDFAEVYAEIGGRLSLTRYYPVGRLMTYQAPGAGIIFDRAVADSLLDRILVQPAMATKAKWEPLLDMVAPNLLVMGMVRAREEGNRERFDVLAAMLEYVLHRNLLSLTPAIVEARAKAEAEAEAMAEAFPELTGLEDGAGNSIPPARVLIASLFADAPPAGGFGAPSDEGKDANGEGVSATAQADRESAMGE